MGRLHLFPRGTLTYDLEGLYSTELFSHGRISYDEIIDIHFMKANWVINGHIKIKTKDKPFLLFNFSRKRNNEALRAYDDIKYFWESNKYKNNQNNKNSNNVYQEKLSNQFQNEIRNNSLPKQKGDINILNYSALVKVPGIGSWTAKEILKNRYGGKLIKSWKEFALEYNVTPKNLEIIKNYLFIEGLSNYEKQEKPVNGSIDKNVNNINSLTYMELIKIPGISTLIAKQILSNRRKGVLISSFDDFYNYNLSISNIEMIKSYFYKKTPEKHNNEVLTNKDSKDTQQIRKMDLYKKQRLENKKANQSKKKYNINDFNSLNYMQLIKIPGISSLIAKQILSNRRKGKKVSSIDVFIKEYKLSNSNKNILINYLNGNSVEYNNENVNSENKKLDDQSNIIINKQKLLDEEKKLEQIRLERKKLEQKRREEEEKKIIKIKEERIKLEKELLEEKKRQEKIIREEKFEKELLAMEKEKERIDELKLLSPIDINTVNIDILKKIPYIDMSKIETLLDLRDNGLYIKSFDDLKGKLSLNVNEINEIKKYVIIKDSNIYPEENNKLDFNNANLIDLLNWGIKEEIVAKIILDRENNKVINSFDELKILYSFSDEEIDNLKKVSYIPKNIKSDDIIDKRIEDSIHVFKEQDKNNNKTKFINPIEKININLATQEELIKLPNIDIDKAKKIIELRNKNIYINSYETLKRLLNISYEELDQIKSITVISNVDMAYKSRKIDF